MHAKCCKSVEVYLDRERKALQEHSLRLAQLGSLPCPLFADQLAGRTGERRPAFEQPGVPVAEDDGAAELLQPFDRLAGLRPRSDVTEADDSIDALGHELGQDGVE